MPPAVDRRRLPPALRVAHWRAPGGVDDGFALRRFDWPVADGVPVRGSVLFQTGRADFLEKYLETLAHWHAAGWHVAGFDWRGQAGSGRYPAPARCGHIPDFDVYLDDLAAFAQEWHATTPGPHIAIGHSMGGHLILRALVERRIVANAVVLVAPMLGMRFPLGPRWGEWLARRIAALGDRARPAWSGNERPATTLSRRQLLTHDVDRYADELWWQHQHPDLLTGPPSWGWVAEAFRSTRILRTDPRTASTATPILALIADADRLVDPSAARRLLERLPNVNTVHFGSEAAHELLREVDAVRDRVLDRIDRFLAEYAAPAGAT